MVTNIRIREEAYKDLKAIQWEMMERDKDPDYKMADVVDEIIMVYNEYKETHNEELAKKKIARDKEESSIKTGKMKLKKL